MKAVGRQKTRFEFKSYLLVGSASFPSSTGLLACFRTFRAWLFAGRPRVLITQKDRLELGMQECFPSTKILILYQVERVQRCCGVFC